MDQHAALGIIWVEEVLRIRNIAGSPSFAAAAPLATTMPAVGLGVRDGTLRSRKWSVKSPDRDADNRSGGGLSAARIHSPLWIALLQQRAG